MTVKVHHLNNSRSHRILWLLEELGADYEVITYQRDAVTRLAPPELKTIHPLGKSPVIEHDGRVIAESGAIIDYLLDTAGGDHLRPAKGSPGYVDYLEMMHFAEGSAMLPLLLGLYVNTALGEAGAPLAPRIKSETASHLGYIAHRLGARDFIIGNAFTAADVQISFVLEAASASGALEHAAMASVKAYLGRLQARDAYQRAVERGGPYDLTQNRKRS